MTESTDIVLKSIRTLLGDKKLPTSLSTNDVQTQAGLSDTEFKQALENLADSYSSIEIVYGSDVPVRISLSTSFE